MSNIRRCFFAALSAISVMPASPAFADSANEIRELKARLRRLEAKVANERQEHAAKGLVHRAASVEAAGAPYPDKFHIKGVAITPGGWFGLESIYRSRFIGADLQTPYWNIPYGNNVAGHTSEFRLTSRASRLSLLVQADVDASTHLAGFIETDFLGAAQTANSNESNSFNPRIRHLYAGLDLDDIGVHVLAGQDWSLATLNSIGVKRDTHITNPSIEAQPMPGVIWTRQPQIRVGKDITKEISAAFSIENPASVVYASGVDLNGVIAPVPGVGAVPGGVSQLPVGGSLFNSANAISFNRLPDFIGKAAYDSTFSGHKAHFEAMGLIRDLTNRAWWGNHSVWAESVGAGAVIEVAPKLLDFQIQGMIGRGIGRYASAQNFDASYQASGALAPIHERTLYGGFTLHATPQTDLYVFAGGEFASKTYSFGGAGKTLYSYGYGNPLYSNAGCDFELTSSATATGYTTPVSGLGSAYNCTGNIKSIRQINGGIWHYFYEGFFGKLRGGAQYTYTQKEAFPGIGATPKGSDSMIFTSLRYYPF